MIFYTAIELLTAHSIKKIRRVRYCNRQVYRFGILIIFLYQFNQLDEMEQAEAVWSSTHLIEKGTDVTMIQKLPGHNDLKTTLRYLHTSKKDLLKIINPLDDLALW